jgi:sec-independent protein translocase protein TatB
MMDVGWGEMLLLAAVALLIFGPEKLPKAAADAGRMVRKMREMASSAQSDLSPGLDVEGLKNDLKSVADLHPKRILGSALSDKPVNSGTPPIQTTNALPPRPQSTPHTSPASAPAPMPTSSTRRVDPDAT